MVPGATKETIPPDCHEVLPLPARGRHDCAQTQSPPLNEFGLGSLGEGDEDSLWDLAGSPSSDTLDFCNDMPDEDLNILLQDTRSAFADNHNDRKAEQGPPCSSAFKPVTPRQTQETPGGESSQLLDLDMTGAELIDMEELVDWDAFSTSSVPKQASSKAQTSDKLPKHDANSRDQVRTKEATALSPSQLIDPATRHFRWTLGRSKTCFGLLDLKILRESSHFRSSPTTVFELFARVVHSTRENFGHRQYFQFQDLLRPESPYATGALVGWDVGGSVDLMARGFMEIPPAGRKCYCRCRLERENRSPFGWALAIIDIQEATWAKIRPAMAELGKEYLLERAGED